MAKLFTNNVDDLEDSITQLMSLIKNPVGHLTKTFLIASMEDLPHSSRFSPRQPIKRPKPPPREDTLPPEDIELIKQVTLTEETLHGIVKELKDSEPQKYKGYIKKLKQKSLKPPTEDTNL